jgi:hypothetical protein
MILLEEIKKLVKSKFKKTSIPHFERTLYWVKKLKPDADEALQIAAYGHDIERPIRVEASLTKINRVGWDKFYEEHQIDSEKIIKEFLSKHTKDKKIIDKVGFLVRHHEEGGIPESDVLMDADSLSYFEKNAPKHTTPKVVSSWGYALVKRKLNFMFNRISSEKAKDIARPMYEKAMSQLEKIRPQH